MKNKSIGLCYIIMDNDLCLYNYEKYMLSVNTLDIIQFQINNWIQYDKFEKVIIAKEYLKKFKSKRYNKLRYYKAELVETDYQENLEILDQFIESIDKVYNKRNQLVVA